MKYDLINILNCPICHNKLKILKVDKEKNSEIHTGELECNNCREVFSIVNFVPRLVKGFNYSDSWGYLWKKTFNTITDEFSGSTFYRDSLHGKYREEGFFKKGFSPFGFNWPQNLENQVILEIGPGTGCHTSYLAKTGCKLVSVDHSNAVDCIDEKILTLPNVNVIQADITKLPVKLGIFNRVWFFQVLQHTPKPQETLKIIRKYLKSGGLVSLTSYGGKPFNPWYYKFTKRVPDKISFQLINTIFPFFIRLRFFFQSRFHNRLFQKFIRGIFHMFDPRDIYYRCKKGLMNEWIQAILYNQTKDEKLLMRHVLINTFDVITPQYTNNCKDNKTMIIWLERAGFQQIKVWGKGGVRANAIK